MNLKLENSLVVLSQRKKEQGLPQRPTKKERNQELTQEVLGVMRELASERMTMLVVTHEMSFARDVADRVVFMEDGLIVEEGPPEQVFHSANPRTRQFVGEN